ncbi:hypothetical protein [Acetitomaculum ruminis]|uniref:hypothetical protein n=1 Tax=Acetitomaculum ruminis TaxID=2382 RepID=UPI001160D9F8|nr:hypothetical protein [Acetitomaculum ruminis]
MDGNDTIEKVINDTFAVIVLGNIFMTKEFIKNHNDYERIINFSTDSSQIFTEQIIKNSGGYVL